MERSNLFSSKIASTRTTQHCFAMTTSFKCGCPVYLRMHDRFPVFHAKVAEASQRSQSLFLWALCAKAKRLRELCVIFLVHKGSLREQYGLPAVSTSWFLSCALYLPVGRLTNLPVHVILTGNICGLRSCRLDRMSVV